MKLLCSVRLFESTVRVGVSQSCSKGIKDEKRCYPLILRYFVFLNRELERKAEMELDVEASEKSVKRKAALLKRRFNLVLECKSKSRFVASDSRFLRCSKEICPKFDVHNKEFTGEKR